jgi:hypothetical protein
MAHKPGMHGLSLPRAAPWAAFVLMALPSPVRAGGHLRYHAADGCPVEASFVAAVEARGGHFESAPAGDAGSVFELEIEPEDGGFHGSLQRRDAATGSTPREVHGATCAEVVDALAVVAAIALQPQTDIVVPAAPTAPLQPVAAPTPTPPAGSQVEPIKHWPKGGGDVGTKDVAVRAGTLRFEPFYSYTLWGGASLGMVSNRFLPRYDLTISRVNFVTDPDARSYLMPPVIRIRFSLLGAASYRFGDFNTQLIGSSVGASICSAPAYDMAGFGLLLCSEFGAGFMNLESRNGQNVKTQTKEVGFGTVGVGAEATYNFAGYFQIGLKLGLDLLINRFGAERPDGTSIFRASLFSGYVTLGAGAHF